MRLVSICVPVYNRLEELKHTLEPILRNVLEEGRGYFEVVVSVNPIGDGQESVTKYVRELHEKYDFIYDVLDKFSPSIVNFKNAVRNASGKFMWIVGDDDLVLPGTIKRIADVLDKYKDITWLFLNTARIRDITELGTAPIDPMPYHIKGGHYADGRSCLLDLHRKIDGGVLFSTSNLYLRTVFLQLSDQNDGDDNFQLASTFISAAKGAAYLIGEPCIIAGLNVSWKSSRESLIVKEYNDYMRRAIGEYYSTDEIEELISYRMRHASLSAWVRMYRMILKGDELGKEVLKEHYSSRPVETITTSIFLPVITVYLAIRRYCRRTKNFIERIIYKHSKDANPEIIKYMRSNNLE